MSLDDPSTASPDSSTFEYGRLPVVQRKRQRYWIPITLSLLAAAGLFVLLVARAAYDGTKAADAAIRDLHATMARQDWDGLYQAADNRYRTAMTADASKALFTGVTRKLGTPVGTKQLGTQVQATMSGKYLMSNFETEFSLNAKGVERVTWRESRGKYLLVGYNIQSDALISR